MSEEDGILAGNHFKQVHTPDGLEAGHIRYESIDILNVASENTKTVTMSWPYPIGVSSGSLLKVLKVSDNSESVDIDDYLMVWVDIEHPALMATQNASIGDSSVFVPTAILEPLNLSQGDFLAVGDELDDVSLHILEIDRETGEVTLESALTEAITVGTALHMHRYFVGTPIAPYRVIPGVVRKWGQDTFDSAFLPANTPLKMRLVNNGNSEKHAFGELSILYGDA